VAAVDLNGTAIALPSVAYPSGTATVSRSPPAVVSRSPPLASTYRRFSVDAHPLPQRLNRWWPRRSSVVLSSPCHRSPVPRLFRGSVIAASPSSIRRIRAAADSGSTGSALTPLLAAVVTGHAVALPGSQRNCDRTAGNAVRVGFDAQRWGYGLGGEGPQVGRGAMTRGLETRAAVIHMALSMFVSPDVAARLARQLPKLGGHVAMVRLAPGLGLCVAKTGGPSHRSVWGSPAELVSCVEDVRHVGR
jgi:hypothetical protein